MISSKMLLRASVMAAAILLTASSHAETIEGALARAYAQNPDLNAQRASLRAVDEQVARARAGFRPKVSATSNYGVANTGGDSGNLNSNSLYSYNTNPRGVGLSVTQNLFNGLQTTAAVDGAESSVLVSRASLQLSEQQILLNAATQYMNVVRDEAVVKLQTANIEVLNEQLRQTQDRFKVGEVTRTDVAQVEAQLAAAHADLSSGEANLEVSRASYQQVIGVAPAALAEASPVSKHLPSSLADAVKSAISGHPQVVAATHAVDVAEAAVRQIEGEFKPSVDLTGSVTQSWDAKYVGDKTTDFRAIGSVTIPIYEQGEASARARAAKETLGQRQLEADSAREIVRSAVAAAWSQFETAKARMTSAQAQIDAATIALNGVREEAKVGQRTTLDVLVAEQTLLSARVSLVTAQRDRVVSSYQVLSATGQLSAASLGLKVTAYDPVKHYEVSRSRIYGSDLSLTGN
jgi:outer membrane protein